MRRQLSAVAALCLLGGCADADAPWTAAEWRVIQSLSPPPSRPPASPSNRWADDERAARWGHRLFFDRGMSRDGQVACATCHQPDKDFSDGRRQAHGQGATTRNAPTVVGAAWLPFLFHDGRRDSLWAQALGPLESESEHGSDRLAIAHHVARQWRADYEAIFGPLPPLHDAQRFPPHGRPVALDRRHPLQVAWASMTAADQDAVTEVFVHVGQALEAYQRKLVPQPSPFDRYVAAVKAGDPQGGGHLDAAARRGLRGFVGAGGCVNCHNGPLLSDKGFHNLGTPPPQDDQGRPVAGLDAGRTIGAGQLKSDEFRCGSKWSGLPADATACAELRFLDPRFEDFQGAFKTPGLRNVARTGPYFHSGQMASLDAVVAFYQTLPGRPQLGHRELTLQPLPSDVAAPDLVAFLHSLTAPLQPPPWGEPPR